MISIIEVFKLAKAKQASDVHITTGSPPALRIQGKIFKLDVDDLTDEHAKAMCYSILSNDQKALFEKQKNLNFSFSIKDIVRLRGSLFFQKSTVAGTFRLLSFSAPKLADLNLPPIVTNVLNYPYGLVLVTGPTGSGKSTSLAAIIDQINQTQKSHIVTFEDPIEIVHQHKKGIINQSEVELDCKSFASGVKNSLRMDPDICLIGEMRDLETIKTSMHLAETGHLVFSSLHTNSAAKTVDRIVSSFPEGEQKIILSQLSTILQAVISQKLVKTKKKDKMVVACEIMFVNNAIRNLIRENKIFQVYNVIQTSSSEGMISLNQSLLDFIKKDIVSSTEAFKATNNKDELHNLLKKEGLLNS